MAFRRSRGRGRRGRRGRAGRRRYIGSYHASRGGIRLS